MDKKQVQSNISNLEELNRALFNSPLIGDTIYYLENSLSIFDLSKFKEGDVLKLNFTPEINNEVNPSWITFKHFLVKDAVCYVKNIVFHYGKFRCGVIFKNDSYKHFETGELFPTKEDDKLMFYFNECDLSILENDQF